MRLAPLALTATRLLPLSFVLSFALSLALSLALAPSPAQAQELPEMVTAKDLLLPCQEADNDARDGYYAHLECVGFLRGFVAGVAASGAEGLCLPAANRDDQLRRAFVRWVHASFSARSKLRLGDAVLAALTETFACE